MDFFIKVLFILLTTTFSAIQSQKLPETVKPENYYLTIDTDLVTLRFSGTVKIDVKASSVTNIIYLHSKDLTIQNVTLSNQNTPLGIRHSFNTTSDLLIINSDTQLMPTFSYQIEIKFQGNLGKENVGYYRAYYLDENKVNKTMAVTHLEATNARRAFPCFDQPNFKAKFQINLIRQKSQVTSSNMDLEKTETITNSNNVMDVYKTTLTMSTYLIAFMVSEYSSLSMEVNGKVFRTFGRPELLMRGDGLYSLKIGPAAIEQMEYATGISYPLAKMDQVPVPNDYYKIGAMENWGMVTYRERMLMYNSDFSTAQEKQKVATIIAHEFAHQWFGDLVTPEWWSYIWLNEGFATFFEHFATDLIETSWDLDLQFITEIFQPALDADSLENSRPMTREVETTDEIAGIYDTIVYEKAASVLRMTERLLGSAFFLINLRSYLNLNMFGNVNPTKLYESLQRPTDNINISEFLKSWETQAGYPVVTVTRKYGVGNVVSITLEQERFLINKENSSSTAQSLWQIPLNYFTQSSIGSSPYIWLNSRSASITLNLKEFNDNTWIVFNDYRKGFYRVNYDERNWRMLITDNNMYNFNLRVENRAQLIDDSFNLARGGYLNYTIPLELGEKIKKETHYVPISTFNTVLSYLDRLSTGHSHHKNIKSYAINCLEPIYNKYGFVINRNDEHLSKLIKNNVNEALCKYGFEKCLNESKVYFDKWIDGGEMIQPDMQSYVYCYGLKKNPEKIETVFEKYANSSEYNEKIRIANGLGCVGTNSSFNTLLNNLINQNVLSQNDKLTAINSILNNNGDDGVKFFLEYLDQNFTQINTKIGSVSTIISNLAARMTTQQHIDLFNSFESHNSASFTPSLKQVVANAKETGKKNLNWMNENKKDITLYVGSSSMIYISFYLLITSIMIQIF
ncbi:aminopeptidase N-like [Onthophagus taurus]|uniref:aminopeptidase N-like n=1 Tax=Onthophagus taurus TaxID=166361 RepID=UPI0039BE9AF5